MEELPIKYDVKRIYSKPLGKNIINIRLAPILSEYRILTLFIGKILKFSPKIFFAHDDELYYRKTGVFYNRIMK